MLTTTYWNTFKILHDTCTRGYTWNLLWLNCIHIFTLICNLLGLSVWPFSLSTLEQTMDWTRPASDCIWWTLYPFEQGGSLPTSQQLSCIVKACRHWLHAPQHQSLFLIWCSIPIWIWCYPVLSSPKKTSLSPVLIIKMVYCKVI